MLFLLQIISGWPELFIVVLWGTIVCRMPAMNLHPNRLSNCRLFDKQRNPLYLKSFYRILKRPFSIPSSGTRLSFLSNRPGLSPEIKSSRPGFFAFLPGSVKRAGFLMGIFILFPFIQLRAASISSTALGGNWSNPATWVGNVIPGSGDDVTIANGATVILDADATVGSLAVGGNLWYDPTTARTLVVGNILTITDGGSFKSGQSGNIRSHRLVLKGSIINNGTLDFSSMNNTTGVEMEFTGADNAIFNSSDAALTNLIEENGLVLNKGTSPSSVLSVIPGSRFEVESDGGSNASGFLTILNGTFNLIGSKALINPVFSADGDGVIPATGGFWLGNQNATVLTDRNLVNYGELQISNGTFQVGTSGEKALITRGNGVVRISGGTLIAGKLNVEEGLLSVSGGKVNLANQPADSSEGPTLGVSANARLELYGNPMITLAYAHPVEKAYNDIEVLSSLRQRTMKGGTIMLGTEATPPGSIFFVNAERILDRLKVFDECGIRVLNTSKANIEATPAEALPVIAFDNSAPTLTAPSQITLNCGESIPAPYASLAEFIKAGGQATDNCGISETSFKLIKEAKSSEKCPYIITRTYEVADKTGNKSIVVHQVVVKAEQEKVPEPVAGKPQEVLKLKSAMAGTVTAIKTGLWTDPTTWSTGVVPAFDDDVVIASPYTVTVNANAVCNNLTINSGSTLNYSGTNTLTVYGNWINNGTYSAGTTGIITLGGTAAATIGGSSTTVFKQFVVNKGAQTNIVQVNSNIELAGDITLTSGTLQINSGVTVNCTHNTGFTIEQPAGMKILGTFNSGAFSIDNKGKFEVAGGTANLGTAVGNSLTIMSSGDFILSSGQINIAGRLELSGGVALISGGTLNLNTVGNNSATASFYLSPTSTMSMTAGNIVFKNPNGTGNLDMFIESGSKTFTGGNITFGGTAGTYRISSEIYPFPSTIAAAAGANLIYKLFIASSGTYNFPLFDQNGTSIPATVAISGSPAVGASIQIETTGVKYSPNNKSSVNYLNRFWTVTTNGISNSVDVTTAYLIGDVTGTESKIAAGSFVSSWTKFGVVNAGAHTLSVNGISASSFTITGISSDPPTVVVTADKNPICLGSSANLTATPTGDTPFTYLWAPATGLSSSTLPNPVATPSATTNYVVTVTDGNGFPGTATITITVSPDNTVTAASSTPTLCINTLLTPITHTTTGATGIGTPTGLPAGVSASWSSNTITISGTPSVSGTFNYNIPLTGGCGAVSAAGIITVTPDNTISLSSAPGTDSQSKCINSTITSITYTTTGAIGATFSNLPTGVNGSWAANVITISGTPSVSGTYTYTVTLTGGCGNVTKVGTITVNPLPVPTITGAASVCNGSTGKIYTTEAGMTGYSWTILPAGSATITNGVGTNNITVTWITSGSKTISVTYTNSNGCIGTSISYGVTVNSLPAPTITASGPTTFCQGATVTLTAAPTGTYSWSNGATTPAISVSSSGTFTVTVTDGNGCIATSAPTVITVNPTPNFTVTSPAPVCSPTTINLSSTITGPGGITYTYYSDASLSTIVPNYTTISTSGIYYIKGQTSAGCYDTKSVTVAVNQTPVGTNTSTSVCSGGNPNVNLSNTVSVPSTFSWIVGSITGIVNGATSGSGATTLSQTLTSSGTGGTVIYRVTPTSATSTCVGTTYSVTVVVQTKPAITTQPLASFTFCARSNATLSAIATSSPPATVQWYYTTRLTNPQPADWIPVPEGTTTISGSGFKFAGTTEDMFEISSLDNTNSHILYKVRYSNICGTTDSSISDVTVSKQGPFVNTDIQQTVSCAGGTITLTAKFTGGSGEPIEAYLQYYDNGTWVTIPGSYQIEGNKGELDYVYAINTSLYPPNPEFRIYATGKCGTTNSSVKIITVQSVVTTFNSCVGGSPVNFLLDGYTTTATVSGTDGWSISPSTGGTINQVSGLFTPMVPGCYTATYRRGGCVDTKPFVVFPAPPSQSIASTCGVSPSIPDATISGFTDEYSVLAPGSSTWSTYADRTTTNGLLSATTGCWAIRSRYKTTSDCIYNTFYSIPAGTIAPCSVNTIYVTVFPPKPSFTAPNYCGTFSLPTVPSYTGFTTQWSFDNGITYSAAPTIPTTPGCYILKARYASSASCGGNTVTGTCESDPVSVVLYPPAPTTVVAAGCGATINVTTPTSYTDFIPQYSFDGGSSWQASNTYIAPIDNCVGYNIKTRYVTQNICGTTPANTPSAIAACGESPSILRKVDTSAPVISCVADQTVCVNSGNVYQQSGTGWNVVVTSENCGLTSSPTAVLSGATMATNLTTLNNVNFNIGVTTVTWTASDGCNTSTCSFSVTVNPKPVINAITVPAICSGGTFTVTPTQPANGTVPAGTTYTWAAPVVAGITGTAAGTNAANISGTLNNTTNAAITVVYSVTPTSGFGCIGNPFDVTVIVNPVLTCSISGPAGPLCPNSTGNTFSAAGGMSNYSWIINGNGTIAAGGNTQTVTITTGANCNAPFLLTLNYNDLTGCSSSCTVTVSVGDTTPPIITCPTAVTVNSDSGQCYATSVSLGTPTVSDACGGTISVTNNAPAQFPIGITTVTWTASDVCGNTSTCSQTVMVRDNIAPVISALSPVTQCSTYTLTTGDTSLDLDASSITDNCFTTCGFSNYLIKWRIDFADGSSIPTGSGTFNTGQISAYGSSIVFPANDVTHTTSTHTITYQVVDCATNSSNLQTRTITVYPTPMVSSPSGTQTYCYGQTVPAILLTGFPSGVVFDVTGGSSIGIANLTGVTSIPSFVATIKGTATLSITPRANGCTGQPVSLVITVLPIPTVTVSPVLQSICSGSTTNINISSTSTGTTFSWTVTTVSPTGSVSGASDGTGNLISQILTNNTSANATVIYRVTSIDNGCGGLPVDVTVSVKPLPVLVINNPAPVCSPATIDLTASLVTAGSSGGLTFTYWTNSSTTTALANPSSVSVSGTYYIKATDSAGGCSVVQPVTVTVNQSPALTSSLTPPGICSGATFVYNPTTDIPATISWSRADIPGGSAAATGTGTINESVFLAVSDANTVPIDYVITMQTATCISTQTVTVQVSPVPQLNYSNLPASICSGEVFSFNPTSNSGTTITWKRDAVVGISNPAVGYTSGPINETLINTTSSSVDVIYIYHLNLNGCQTDIPIKITVFPAPQITASASKTAVCSGESFNLSSSSPVNTPTIPLLTEGFNGATSNWTTVNGSGNPSGTRASTAWTLHPDNYRLNGSFPRIHTNDNSQFYMSSSNGHSGSTSTIIRSPAIDITGYNVLNLDFYHYFNYRGNGGAESAVVEVSTDGTNWAAVATYTSDQGSATNFAHPTINLNAYAGNSTLYVRFRYTASQDYYWAIDNVTVSGVALPTIEWTSTPAGFTSSVANPTGLTEAQTTAYTVKYTYPQSYGFLCSGIATVTVTVRTPPQPIISADYCSEPGKIILTASGGTSYVWSTGETTNPIRVTVAGTYSVLATDAYGCTGTGYLGVSNELVVNGDFTAGNSGFTSGYFYQPDVAGNMELYNDVSPVNNGYGVGTSGQNYHPDFWGFDHTHNTTGSRNFMIVNGHGSITIWQETVTVQPNTDYYFSAWAMSLNDASPYARLQFEVNGTAVGTIANLGAGPADAAQAANSDSYWVRFYSNPKWNSGAVSGPITIRIINNENALGGNDFALDDISFGTLDPMPATFTPTVTGNNPACEGSTVTLTANLSGGKAPYTYSWTGPSGFSSTATETVLTNVTAAMGGIYTLTVSDGYGCTPVSKGINIAINPAATVNAGPDQAVCASAAVAHLAGSIGGSASSATWTTSGSGSFSNANLLNADYFLGAADIAAGVVTLTLTTNDPAGVCSAASDQMVITIHPMVTAQIGTTTDPLCHGSADGSISVSATGGKMPYTYSWNTTPVQSTATATNLAAGTYTVTVSDANGCSGTASATLIDPPALVVDNDIQFTEPTCYLGNDGAATVVVTSGATPTFLWDNGQTTAHATGLGYGMHTVKVTSANFCSSVTLSVFITQPDPPTISCPSDIITQADFGKDFASNVGLSSPTYVNDCPVVDKTWTISGATTDTSSSTGINNLSVHDFNVGTSSVTYTIIDLAGNVRTCTFTVTVISRPDIDCAASIVTYTASNNCSATLDPGVPTLIQGAQPITWTWTIDNPLSADITGTSTTTPGPIGSYTFDYGTTTITWTATNISGTDSCTQTVTVIDNVPPVYTPPPTDVEYCVENLISATYNSADPVNNVTINPDPDYYLFRTGVNSDTSLDLNVANLNDNCCPGTISWTITFTAVPGPVAPHNPVVYPPVSGMGQPSAYPSDIQLWGDGVNYTPVVHQIAYTVTDCHGNSTSFNRDITVKPRPKLTKMP